MESISTWFGFVGSCMAGGPAACKPFLAFVALTAASCVALALVILAYRAMQKEQAKATPDRRARTAPTREIAPRVVRPVPRPRHNAPIPALHVTA